MKTDLSGQVDHAIYLPALHPIYINTVNGDPKKIRSLPGSLTLDDLNFLDPQSQLFHLPCALYSAGVVEDLSKRSPSMISNRDQGTLIMGDSGGYQIANGQLQIHDDNDRRRIFDWLVTNSDVAITLDVPTVSLNKPESGYRRFGRCIKDTLEHLRCFEAWNADAGHYFLNVLQGNDREQSDEWYSAVKDFEFHGWAFAGPLKSNFYLTIRRLLQMEKEGLIGGQRNWVHFLGIGDLRTAALLTIIRDGLRERLGDEDIQFSMDTSTPIIMVGMDYNAYTEPRFNRRQMSVEMEKLPVNDPDLIGSKKRFPHPVSPIGKVLTLGDLIVKNDTHRRSRWDSLSHAMIVNHNFYVYMDAVRKANDMLSQPRSEVEGDLPSAVLDAKEAIQEVFADRFPDARLQQNKKVLDAVTKGAPQQTVSSHR